MENGKAKNSKDWLEQSETEKKTERSETEQYAKFKSRTARKVRKCDCREKSEEVQSTVESQKQNS